MDSAIEYYIALLTNNTLVAKYFKMPHVIDRPINPLTDLCEIDETKKTVTYSVDDFLSGVQNESIQPDNLRAFEINGYRSKKELIDYFDAKYDEFKYAFVRNGYSTDKTLIKGLSEKLSTSMLELHMLSTYRGSREDQALHGLVKTKIAYCGEVYSFIRGFTIAAAVPVAPKPVRVRKSIENLTSLTQNQIIILFHYLRELEYIGKRMPNNIYAGHIAQLTGFSEEKIRQFLSHVSPDSDSVESESFQETDYDAVWRALKHILGKIEPKRSR